MMPSVRNNAETPRYEPLIVLEPGNSAATEEQLREALPEAFDETRYFREIHKLLYGLQTLAQRVVPGEPRELFNEFMTGVLGELIAIENGIPPEFTWTDHAVEVAPGKSTLRHAVSVAIKNVGPFMDRLHTAIAPLQHAAELQQLADELEDRCRGLHKTLERIALKRREWEKETPSETTAEAIANLTEEMTRHRRELIQFENAIADINEAYKTLMKDPTGDPSAVVAMLRPLSEEPELRDIAEEIVFSLRSPYRATYRAADPAREKELERIERKAVTRKKLHDVLFGTALALLGLGAYEATSLAVRNDDKPSKTAIVRKKQDASMTSAGEDALKVVAEKISRLFHELFPDEQPGNGKNDR